MTGAKSSEGLPDCAWVEAQRSPVVYLGFKLALIRILSLWLSASFGVSHTASFLYCICSDECPSRITQVDRVPYGVLTNH